MGYGVELDIKDLVILAPSVRGCLDAINALHEDASLMRQAEVIDTEAQRNRQPIRDVYAYGHVVNPTGNGFPTLVEAFSTWSYEAIEMPDGSVVVQDYIGEKWEYDELLYTTIAPYVIPGAAIVVRGEDGAISRFLFEETGVRMQHGTFTFEDS